KGTTVAGLGSGSYPLDMVAFKSNGADYVMIVNNNRGLMRVKAEDLAKPQQPITTPAEPGTGTPFQHVHGQGVLQAENYGDDYLLYLGRSSLTGTLNLSTLPLNRQ